MVQGSNGKYFACDECPICEDIERRILFTEKYNLEPQLEYCYCDKVGRSSMSEASAAMRRYPPKKNPGMGQEKPAGHTEGA